MNQITLSTVPKPVEFNISKDLLGEGTFRQAYKAETNNKEFSHSTWVVKEYKSSALEIISEIKQSVEAHTKKVVQMHCLAQNFANQCRREIQQAGLEDTFGDNIQIYTLERKEKNM